MEIIRIGYYNSEGIWFNINEFRGFGDYPYPPEDVQIIALVLDNLDNNNEVPMEVDISRDEAVFLERLYRILK